MNPMDTGTKALIALGTLVLLMVIGFFNIGAIHRAYTARFNPPAPAPPPPDMSDFIAPPTSEALPPDGTPGEVAVGKLAYVAGQHEGQYKMDEIPLWNHIQHAHPEATEKYQVRHGQRVRIYESGKGPGGTWYRVETVGDDWPKPGWIEGRFLRAAKPKDALPPKPKRDWLKEHQAEEERRKKGSYLD